MKCFFITVFVAFIWNTQAQECNNLFISEYIEGSSSNKAIEMFNPTLAELDLKNYKIELYNNGSVTPTMTFYPKGKIASGETFVVAHPSSNALLLSKADTVFGFSYNGNDAILLIDTYWKDTLDYIGIKGDSPTNYWALPNGGTTQNQTLIRKPEIEKGGLWASASITWDTLSVDDFSNIGSHRFNGVFKCSVYDGLVGFNESLETNISFYPNPVVDVLRVDVDGAINSLRIVDVYGNVPFEVVAVKEYEGLIDVSDFQKRLILFRNEYK